MSGRTSDVATMATRAIETAGTTAALQGRDGIFSQSWNLGLLGEPGTHLGVSECESTEVGRGSHGWREEGGDSVVVFLPWSCLKQS